MSDFAGTWQTTRYLTNNPDNPEPIVLTISVDSDPAFLDGAYARTGQDARLYGALDASGLVWSVTIDEAGSTGDSGSAVFFLDATRNVIHGAWISNQSGNAAQPWFGHRV